jgi:serine/threonine-protein kinase RsbT
MGDDPRAIAIDSEAGVAVAVRAARELALAAGLGDTEAVQAATAVSEIATNQLRHATGGRVELRVASDGERSGLEVRARDAGPGIADVELALRDGWSSAGSLGIGLPGARRLMDDFTVASDAAGTEVRMAKWRQPRAPAAGGLAEWAVAANPADGAASAEVIELAHGLLLAVVARAAVPLLRTDPAGSPAALVDRCGGRGAVVASFTTLDGRLVWRAAPPAAAALLRVTAEGAATALSRAPRRRAAIVPVLRGDVLVLASCPIAAAALEPADPAGGDLAALAGAARAGGPPGAVALAARFARGALEPRPRR